MNNSFDRVDWLSALGLFLGVSVWACVWSYPCPPPDSWPFLVAVQDKINCTVLGAAGRCALGVSAALVYLTLRGFWFLNRHAEDVLPDRFFHTRAATICGAAIFALLPSSWRAGQFLQPGFSLLVLIVLGLFLWLCGRDGRGLVVYSIAYLLLGCASGANLLGFVPLGFVVGSDVVLRWQDGQTYDQREEDELVERKKSTEAGFSFLSAAAGLILGGYVLTMLANGNDSGTDLSARLEIWWRIWTGSVARSVGSPLVWVTALFVVVSAVGQAIGRRMRSFGPYGLMKARVLFQFLLAATVVLLLMSVDRPQRKRLQALREYASLVAEDVRGVKFLFTDGRFDDLLRLEFASRGLETEILNTMSAPTPDEAARLKACAPELGDQAIFEAGGAEVFRAWARERPDRLAESAWQLGEGLVRRYGKTRGRTFGAVLRCADAIESTEADAADARFRIWSERIRTIVEARADEGFLLGRTDETVASRFDALLWRAARLSGERAAGRRTDASERDRKMMERLDELNASLQTRGEVTERMLPTEKLVLSAREALDVALKRADFVLAQRYAEEILAGVPEDPTANFALGMASLEMKEYFKASLCFEKTLKGNPNEPAALNNLAIAYLNLGQKEKALDCAERAAKALPNSAEVQRTLSEIRGAIPDLSN